MFDKLDQIEARYEDLGRQLGDPALLADQKKFQTVAKQHRGSVICEDCDTGARFTLELPAA